MPHAPTLTRRLNGLWKKDLSAVSPPKLRAARYALQMVARCPFLHERFEDDGFMASLWALALPLIEPNALAQCETVWMRADPNDDEDEDKPFRRGLRKHSWGKSFPGGVPGARMRNDLKRLFGALPTTLLKRIKAADVPGPSNPVIAVIAGSTGLDAIETAILDFVEKKANVTDFRTLLSDAGTNQMREHFTCLAAALDLPVRELQLRLHRSRSLHTLQLVRRRHNRSDLEDFIEADELLNDLFAQEPATPDELLACLVEPTPAVQCVTRDFPHLERDAQRLQTVLVSALKHGELGINALLYGLSGTGKTQFALASVAACGLTAVMVKTADHDGDGLSRQGRLGAYQLTQRLLHGRRDCVIIFDEVEDVFHNADTALFALLGGEASTGSEKGWMNRTLEGNPVPAIWITNNAASMDPAFLRRFLLPVSFGTPPREVRRQIAERHLGDQAVPDDLIEELAADDALQPAFFSAARRLIELQPEADPISVIREGVSASRRLLHGSPLARVRKPATVFDAAYLNLAGGMAPARIGDALARTGRGSLCFFGPPGTGKTEFAHVLADALGRELIARSTADLVSKYVGQTEQNLARLFADLDVERSILFLDEIDSLLRDRRLARHSWETTQVNELLQQMERFPGIFIAATNLIDQLDAAALRRFDFKLHFRPLSAVQRRLLFAREALGDERQAEALPAPLAHKLTALEALTPGDFANVARQRDLMGEALSPEDFLRRLSVECRWKQQAEHAG